MVDALQPYLRIVDTNTSKKSVDNDKKEEEGFIDGFNINTTQVEIRKKLAVIVAEMMKKIFYETTLKLKNACDVILVIKKDIFV